MQQVVKNLNVSQEQVDRCTRWIDESNNQVFYLVESMSNPGTHYKVVFDRERKSLRCLPHDGEPCPASLKGLTCWHMKAAYAHAHLLRQEQAEQSQIESYVRQGLDRESATRVVYAQPTQYSELEVERAECRNERKPFSILR